MEWRWRWPIIQSFEWSPDESLYISAIKLIKLKKKKDKVFFCSILVYSCDKLTGGKCFDLP